MKSYTDIEQSKKLAEILKFKSADYTRLGKNEDNVLTRPYLESFSSELAEWIGENNIFPCWSLAALLNILPSHFYDKSGKNSFGIDKDDTCYNIFYENWNSYIQEKADNLVDVCYRMILKLHELKML